MRHRLLLLAASCFVLTACAAHAPKPNLGRIAIRPFGVDGNVTQVTRYDGPTLTLATTFTANLEQRLKARGWDVLVGADGVEAGADTVVSGNITRIDGGSRGGRAFASVLFGFGLTSWGIGGSSCRVDGQVNRRDGTRVGTFGAEQKRRSTGYFWIYYGKSSERQLRECLVEGVSPAIAGMINSGGYSGGRLPATAAEPPKPPGDIRTPSERLRDLDALRSQHLITEEEYTEKRRKILEEF